MPEMSLAGFIAHIAGVAAHLEMAEHKALDRAAKLIKEEAKREIGNYQDAVGPIAAWAQLAQSTIEEKEKLGYSPPDDPLLREGDMRDSIDHMVEKREASIGSNSDVAVYQELGTTKIPPRSFLAGAAFRKAEKVAEILGSAPVAALVGEEVVNGYLRIT